MATVDNIDEQLIRLLQEDSRQSSEQIARLIHVSPRTVRRRIKELTNKGIMRSVVLVDPEAFGYPILAVIAFNVIHGKLKQATEALSKRPEVKWVVSTAGNHDILSLARFHTTDELSDFLEEELATIDGISSTETFFCLNVKKGRYMMI
jgi:Lrp/AsnC family transcriptional regulator, regulator for asnA, asnC and gidA